MADNVITISADPVSDVVIVVAEPTPIMVNTISSGPPGPRGLQGEQGPPGKDGEATLNSLTFDGGFF